MAKPKMIQKALICGSFVVMLGVVSACSSSSGLSFIPNDLRATLEQDAAKKKGDVSVDDVLASARKAGAPESGETVIGKTRNRLTSLFKRGRKKSSPVFSPVESKIANLEQEHDAIADFLGSNDERIDSVVAKTTEVDTTTTASVSAHSKSKRTDTLKKEAFLRKAEALRQNTHRIDGKQSKTVSSRKITRRTPRLAGDGRPTNAAIAQNWVETGPADLEGLPVAGFDDNTGTDGKDASADLLFSSYLERTQNTITNEKDYNRDLERAARSATYEQDATEVFERARSLSAVQTSAPTREAEAEAEPKASPNELLAQSRALIARSRAARPETDNNDLLVKAHSMLKKSAANAPKQAILTFNPQDTTLTKNHQGRIKKFIHHHKGRKITIEAGLGSEGSAFDKLARAQTRLGAITHTNPALTSAERVIKPDLPANTIRIGIAG